MRVLSPPENESIPPQTKLVFLAGPIQVAPNWQTRAIELLEGSNGFWVANPRRDYLPSEFDYEAQVDWETRRLRRAAAGGVVLFWLAAEGEHDPERSYAQTSRFELGEWKERALRSRAQMVIGIEAGFSGARYIRRRFSQDHPKVPIVESLEVACGVVKELLSAESQFKI